MRIRPNVLAILATSLLVTVCAPASAQYLTYSSSYTTSLPIPDCDPVGVTDTRSVTMPGATAITDLQVDLNIAGGFNGDFYAYLRHGTTGFAVLLNRVGVTSADPFGYSDSGMDVTLTGSSSSTDIHYYQVVLNPLGANLTGIWQPDGRSVDPAFVLGSTPRTAMLNSLYGMDPNGQWTLFVSDNSSLGVGTLQSWGLTITAVPEPAGLWFLTAGFLVALSRHWCIPYRKES